MEKRMVANAYLDKHIFKAAKNLPLFLLVVAVSYLFTGIICVLLLFFYEEQLLFVQVLLVIELLIIFFQKISEKKATLPNRTAATLNLLTVVMKIVIVLVSPLLEIMTVCAILIALSVIFFIWAATLALSRINFLSTNGMTVVKLLFVFSLLNIYTPPIQFDVALFFSLPVIFTYIYISLLRKNIFHKSDWESEDFRFSFGFFRKDGDITGLKIVD